MKKGILFVFLLLLLTLVGCDAKYTSIKIDEESNVPIKINELDIDKIKIELCIDGEVKDTLPLSNSMLSSEDIKLLSIVGTHTITVNYQELSVEFTIEIVGEKYGEYCIVQFYKDDLLLDEQEVEYGSDVIYEKSSPYKAQDDEYEYTFTGWDKSLENITEDTIINAKFDKKSLYHNVTFLGFEDEVLKIEERIYKNYPATAPNIPEVKGYEFIEWDSDFYRVKDDMVVKAIYKPIEYTVSFDANIESTVSAEEKTFDNKTEFTTEFFTDFFEFLKSKVNDISGLTLEGTSYSYTRNSVKASWIDVTSLMAVDKSIVEKTIGNLIYKPFERSDIKNAYEIEDEGYFLNSNKYRMKYKDFDVYFLNCISTTYSSYSTGYNATSAGKVQIFYRFWQWNQGTNIVAFNTFPKCYITTDSIDPSSIQLPTEFKFTAEDNLIISNPTTELTFLGWYDNVLGYGKKYETIGNGTYNNIVLYAKWDMNPETIEVTFVDYDGKVISTNEYNNISEIVIPTKPSRIGYTFKGWDIDLTSITNDTCIQAEYDVIKYTISYVDNNDNEVKYVGEEINEYTIEDKYLLPKLECEGYIFIGWYDNNFLTGTKITKTTSGNITLYAKWLNLEDIEVSDLELVVTDEKVVVGLSTRVYAKIGTTYYSCKEVDFVSDDKVSIDVDGFVIGLRTGKSTIIASYGTKQATVEIDIIDKQEMLWVGHTGCKETGVIQNTAAAFEEGGKRGYYALECDVRISSDNVLYIHHDDTFLLSGTVQPWVEDSLTANNIKSGAIQNSYTWNVLKTLKLHRSGDSSVEGYLCTVEEYLNICKKYNCKAVIEIKWNNGMNSNDQSKLPLLISLVEKCGMYEKAIFMTSMKNCLSYIRDNYADANLQFLSGASTTTNDNIDWCIENRISLDATSSKVTKDIVDKMHANGLYVNAYTVNDTVTANSLINMGVDMITTDSLGQ